MAIKTLNRDQFERVLKRTLSPTTPIRSPELLRGRERKLEDIRRAFSQGGRHIFIYGDRGVGKTSLAQTAAFEHHPSAGEPILLGCDNSTSFYKLARDLAARLLKYDPMVAKRVVSRKGGAAWLLSAEAQHSIEHGRIPDLQSMNEVVDLIGHIVTGQPEAPVVVIDEFERVSDRDQRGLFADFIKQVGDQSLSLKLIFCGVGAALDELLDAHHSCYRYLAAVQLERLQIAPRLQIIDNASAEAGVAIDDTTRYRMAIISDGFPHYVHLLTEKLLWEVFDDRDAVTSSTPEHYTAAVRAAVQDIEPHLKALYQKATLKYTDEYEPVLWAVADHHELIRRSSDIFESYKHILTSRGFEPLSRERFNGRMNSLKQPSHGSILKATRQGWYEFKEAVVRGYVRLRAEERGVQLGRDHPLERRANGRFGSL